MHPYESSIFLAVASSILLTTAAPISKEEGFSLVLLHNNDMHGRFEETERNSGSCQAAHKNNSCVGGFARTAHMIRKYRKMAEEGSSPPVLYLNAGDTFVGTAWFSVFTWNISSAFINMLQPDAMSLGNHEFDLSAGTLAPFVNAVKSPVLAANLNFSQEPTLNHINQSIVLEVSGRKIGIIGYLTPETTKISTVGKVTFSDEVEAIRKESEELTKQGVNIIVALGHSGYVMDQTIAKEAELVDVVIGGHTNTFLWNGAQPDTEVVEDLYPKIITQASGKQVPVVQAYAYTKYIGVLNVTFNENGDLIHFAGQPIFLDSHIPQEDDVLQLLEVYRPAIDDLNSEIVGSSKVVLDGNSAVCRHEECNLGNLITDALVSYVTSISVEQWTSTPIGLYNGGGIRNTINPAENNNEVTRGDLIGVLPFGNQVISLTLKGSDLVMVLEQGVRSNGETSYGEFPQVSGLKVVIDMSKPAYSRVASVKARCGLCEIPVYETVDPEKNYTLVTSSFLADGGDGITTLKEKGMNRKIQDLSDLDVVVWYFGKYSPVYPEVQERIILAENNNVSPVNGNKKNTLSWTLLLFGLLLYKCK